MIRAKLSADVQNELKHMLKLINTLLSNSYINSLFPIHQSIPTLIHPSIHSFIHSFIYSFIHLFITFIQRFVGIPHHEVAHWCRSQCPSRIQHVDGLAVTAHLFVEIIVRQRWGAVYDLLLWGLKLSKSSFLTFINWFAVATLGN